MPERRLSDKQRRWLQAEIADWLGRGVITSDQSQAIFAGYESVESIGHRKRSLFVFSITGIAALLVGLAVLLVISHNWAAIPGWLKLANLFALIVVAHSAAFCLRYWRNVGRWTEVVFLLGCLLFGAGIWLIGQVFHLDAHWPDALWWWAIGVLPFALGLDTILLHCLFVGLVALWAGVEVLGYPHLIGSLFWGWWMPPNGAYSVLVLAAPGMLWAYRRGSALALGLYVPLFAWWVVLQALAWECGLQSIFLVGCVGALMLIVGENHRHGSPLAMPYRIYGTLLVAGTLVPLSFAEFCKELGRDWHRWRDQPIWYASAVVIGMMVLTAVTLVGCVVARSRRTVAGEPIESPGQRFVGLVRDQWVPVSLTAVMVAMSFSNLIIRDQHEAWIVPTVLSNVSMIVLALWLMRVGLRDDRGRPFAAGVIYFLIWALIRYIDLFGWEKGGMLGAAMMFFVSGAVLFGVAFFWRARKEAKHV